MISLKDIQEDPTFLTLIDNSSAYLKARGYTDHGLRHVTREFRSNICCPDTEMSCRTTLQDIFFCVLIHFYVA